MVVTDIKIGQKMKNISWSNIEKKYCKTKKKRLTKTSTVYKKLFAFSSNNKKTFSLKKFGFSKKNKKLFSLNVKKLSFFRSVLEIFL